jgi:site-specific DNA-methyltransferase (adenine-specific)
MANKMGGECGMENKRPFRLVWDSKIESAGSRSSVALQEMERVTVNPVFDNQEFFVPGGVPRAEGAPVNNLYYYGDNYDLLQALTSGGNQPKIDLIYIDPPYMTDQDYHSTISIGTYSEVRHINRQAFQDKWPGGLDSYLDMMYPRLQLMREVLDLEGSILVHVDWHASHYIRVLLDEIFGPENFINEIAWCFGGGSSSHRYFHRKHDLIFWYARGSKYTYNPQYRPYTQGTMQRGLTNVKGDRYKLNEEGALMQDWWVDINKILSPTARENLKFPTQKPKELLRRLIAAASPPGGRVVDLFAGSGTLAEVCNEMGRNWILADNSKLALQTSLYRLIRSGSPPFTIARAEHSRLENESGALVLKKPGLRAVDDHTLLISIGIEYFQPAVMDERVVSQDFADYIEFWEIDLDFNGTVFNSHYQVIRPRQRFKEPIALDMTVRTVVRDEHKIAVKVWDAFANQTLGVVTWRS